MPDENIQPEQPIKTPPLIEATQDNTYKKDDPPLIKVQVTNPVTYLKLWLKRLLRNEGIDLRIKIRPLTAIAIFLTFAIFFAGTGFSVGKIFFPNSSPILKREVVFQGVVKKLQTGDFYLQIDDSNLYKLKPTSKIKTNFQDLLNREVMVKGNLTREQNTVDVSQIVAFE